MTQNRFMLPPMNGYLRIVNTIALNVHGVNSYASVDLELIFVISVHLSLGKNIKWDGSDCF